MSYSCSIKLLCIQQNRRYRGEFQNSKVAFALKRLTTDYKVMIEAHKNCKISCNVTEVI